MAPEWIAIIAAAVGGLIGGGCSYIITISNIRAATKQGDLEFQRKYLWAKLDRVRNGISEWVSSIEIFRAEMKQREEGKQLDPDARNLFRESYKSLNKIMLDARGGEELSLPDSCKSEDLLAWDINELMETMQAYVFELENELLRINVALKNG